MHDHLRLLTTSDSQPGLIANCCLPLTLTRIHQVDLLHQDSDLLERLFPFPIDYVRKDSPQALLGEGFLALHLYPFRHFLSSQSSLGGDVDGGNCMK